MEKQTSQTDARHLKSQRRHSDIPSEDRWDRSELRDSLPSDHHLMHESCRGGDFKLFYGDVISDDVMERKRREKNQRDSEAEGQQQLSKSHLKTSDEQFRTNSSRQTFLQDQMEAAAASTQEKNTKLREKTAVRNVGYSVKTFDASSSVSVTLCPCEDCAAHENSLKKNYMKKQPVTSKPVRKGENTGSQTKKRVKKPENKNTRTAWK